MSAGRKLLVACAAAAALAALVVPAAPARMSDGRLERFLVGAATVDVTPPPFDATADAAAFPLCPRALFGGPRTFALQEPYRDTNGDGEFHYPEPYCDANHNGRYDGMYLSGAIDHVARRVHDPIDARAVAFSDGRTTAVLVSVVSQGIFETYTHRIRDRARTRRQGITDLIVSSNHNESSPDPVGIYGAPDVEGVTGGRSGIDDYYMAFLVDRVADAAVRAYDAMRPATIRVTTFPLPSNLEVHLSHNFPTTDDDRQPAAIDPKIRVLAAKGVDGRPIVTLMNLSAHNQQIGHSDALAWDVSADWPGAFHRRLEQLVGGTAMFLVGVNGSEEDPSTVPPVDCDDGCYAQADATGNALADAVAAHVAGAQRARFGDVTIRRDEFDVPLENNLFKAAAAAGIFGERQAYVAGEPAGPGIGTDLRTEVSLVRLGPDIELLGNPGESFPALVLGSPWGIEDAPCPDRPNPPVPNWHAGAKWRFQIGLADDLIGYLSPAWAFTSAPGVYTTTCFNDADDRDAKGHQHKLETESVGPTAGNLVAEHLTALLDATGGPPAGTTIAGGRWLRGDGSGSTHPVGAAGAVLSDGRVLTGVRFVDYDGALQSRPDLSTRGVLTRDGARIFLNVYPSLEVTR